VNLLVQINDAHHLARFAAALVKQGDVVHTAESLDQLQVISASYPFDGVVLEWSDDAMVWANSLEGKRLAFLAPRERITEIVTAYPTLSVLPLPGTAPAARCTLSPDAATDPVCRLGDYQLLELEALGRRTHAFNARQVSIDRPVVLHLLNQEYDEDDASLDEFINDARAKAAVSHDRIGSVYQALEEGRWIFYTAELLPGPTVADFMANGQLLPADVVLETTRTLASALSHLEVRQLLATPVELRHIHFENEHSLFFPKLTNPAIAGRPEPGHHGAQFLHTLRLLRPMLDPEDADAAPLGEWLDTLLATPRNAVNLVQIVSAAKQRQQEKSTPTTVPVAASSAQNKTPRTLVTIVVALVLVSLVAIFALSPRDDAPPPPPPIDDLWETVRFSGGTFNHPQHGQLTLQPFDIDKYEVTIRDYAAFLKALTQGDSTRFDHRKQPQGKKSHDPEEWREILSAAEGNTSYQGHHITLNCPVFNVDWWDAFAYARWRSRRLPTAEEWEFAVGGKSWRAFPWGNKWDATKTNGAKRPAPIAGHSAWCPVNLPDGDATPEGVHNLAGNVSEWTATEQMHPEFPDRMIPVVKGGSFASRRPVKASSSLPIYNKKERQPWLGFRTASTLPSSP